MCPLVVHCSAKKPFNSFSTHETPTPASSSQTLANACLSDFTENTEAARLFRYQCWHLACVCQMLPCGHRNGSPPLSGQPSGWDLWWSPIPIHLLRTWLWHPAPLSPTLLPYKGDQILHLKNKAKNLFLDSSLLLCPTFPQQNIFKVLSRVTPLLSPHFCCPHLFNSP